MKTGKRSIRLVCVVSMALLSSFTGCDRQEEKIHKVGVLNGFAPFSDLSRGFYGKMTELGYHEGENILYFDFTVMTGSIEEQQALEKFLEEKVDLIYVFPTGSVVNARAVAGDNMPIVFGLAGIEGTNLVKNNRQPGRNITGVRVPGVSAVMKRFEYLVNLFPPNPRIYTAYNKDYIANQPVLLELREHARSLGVVLIEVPVSSVEEIRLDIEKRRAAPGIDGILILSDDLSQSPEGWKIISSFATDKKIPINGGSVKQLESGGLMSYAADFVETGKIAAIMADKVLRGTDPGTIPLATASMALVINMRLAQDFGIEVPEYLQNMAVRLIW